MRNEKFYFERMLELALRWTFPNCSTCMANKLNTIVKHGFGLAAKPYKTDSFKEEHAFLKQLKL